MRAVRPGLHERVHVVGVDEPRARQVEHLVADGDADVELRFARAAKASEREVLDRKIRRRIVGRGDPARQRRVVRLVELWHRVLR